MSWLRDRRWRESGIYCSRCGECVDLYGAIHNKIVRGEGYVCSCGATYSWSKPCSSVMLRMGFLGFIGAFLGIVFFYWFGWWLGVFFGMIVTVCGIFFMVSIRRCSLIDDRTGLVVWDRTMWESHPTQEKHK